MGLEIRFELVRAGVRVGIRVGLELWFELGLEFELGLGLGASVCRRSFGVPERSGVLGVSRERRVCFGLRAFAMAI